MHSSHSSVDGAVIASSSQRGLPSMTTSSQAHSPLGSWDVSGDIACFSLHVRVMRRAVERSRTLPSGSASAIHLTNVPLPQDFDESLRTAVRASIDPRTPDDVGLATGWTTLYGWCDINPTDHPALH